MLTPYPPGSRSAAHLPSTPHPVFPWQSSPTIISCFFPSFLVLCEHFANAINVVLLPSWISTNSFFLFIFFCQLPSSNFFHHPLLIPCVVQRPGKLLLLPYLIFFPPTLGFTLTSPITLRTPNNCPSECLTAFPCYSLPCFPQRSLTNRNVCVLIFSEWKIFLSQLSFRSMTLCTTTIGKMAEFMQIVGFLWVFVFLSLKTII